MANLKSRKAALAEVPGLAYFTPEAAPVPRPALPAPALSALEQMFAYYVG